MSLFEFMLVLLSIIDMVISLTCAIIAHVTSKTTRERNIGWVIFGTMTLFPFLVLLYIGGAIN